MTDVSKASGRKGPVELDGILSYEEHENGVRPDLLHLPQLHLELLRSQADKC